MAFSLLLGGFFVPVQAEAGLISSILGSKASASVDAANTGNLYKNSQNMELPEANVSFASVIENKNKKKEEKKEEENVIDPDTDVILDDSSTALVPNLGLGGDDSSDSDSDQISFYTVHSGDTWSGIAEMYGVTVNTILWANDKKQTDKLVEGNILLIPPISGIEHTVKSGQTCQSLAKMYKVEASDIAEYNNLSADCVVKSGDELFIPDAVKPEEAPVKKSTTSVAKKNNSKNSSGQKLSGYFINPLSGARKSQGLHDNNAVDLAISTGTPIHASAAGTVSLAKNGYNGGFGNLVIINHPNGTQTLYAHQSKLSVTTGEQVTQGQVIGYVGSTGRSTGPHLHFEVHGAYNPGLDNSWAK